MVRNKHNTPGIIKFNFWRQVSRNPEATYACLNMTDADAPRDIEDRSICINGDSGTVLAELLGWK